MPFRYLIVQAKKHAWWIVPSVSGIAGGLWMWVQGVNATQTDVVLVKDVLPRIERQMMKVDRKLDTLDDKIDRVDNKVSNIEGRLSGR